jgi:hypothetical protein
MSIAFCGKCLLKWMFEGWSKENMLALLDAGCVGRNTTAQRLPQFTKTDFRPSCGAQCNGE